MGQARKPANQCTYYIPTRKTGLNDAMMATLPGQQQLFQVMTGVMLPLRAWIFTLVVFHVLDYFRLHRSINVTERLPC